MGGAGGVDLQDGEQGGKVRAARQQLTGTSTYSLGDAELMPWHQTGKTTLLIVKL